MTKNVRLGLSAAGQAAYLETKGDLQAMINANLTGMSTEALKAALKNLSARRKAAR